MRRFSDHGYGPSRSIRSSWFISKTRASRSWRARTMPAVRLPRSVTTAARVTPSSTTYATGSEASWGRAIGVTVSPERRTGTPPRTAQRNSSGGGSRSSRKVPRVACTRTLSLRARIPAAWAWSACSCVRKTSVRSRTSRPALLHLRAVSRSGRPASIRMRAAPASTQTELPPLPLARTHKRTERMYQHRSTACKRAQESAASCARRALCYTARHAPHEKVHQEPEQGEAAGPEAEARAKEEGPAPGNAGAVAEASAHPTADDRSESAYRAGDAVQPVEPQRAQRVPI